ncbi:hypothetical protein SNEBB_010805 [Seison nebaliae]|nr:hypothetical protein SNEBB_010805 [Seison nebaliae]
MNYFKFLLFFCLVIGSSFGEEESEKIPIEINKENIPESEPSVTVKLNGDNFQDHIEGLNVTLILFYEDDKSEMFEIFEEAAKTMKLNKPPATFGCINVKENEEFIDKFSIKKKPEMILFKNGEATPYEGGWEMADIISSMMKEIDPNFVPPIDPVAILTKDNFEDFIGRPLSLVMFYAPWCGHCKNLMPEYMAAAEVLEVDMIPLGKLDATTESEIASKYSIQGYPTLLIFRNGKQFEFKGGRTKSEIVEGMRKEMRPPSQQMKSYVDVKDLLSSPNDYLIVAMLEDKKNTVIEEIYKEFSNLARNTFPILIHFYKNDKLKEIVRNKFNGQILKLPVNSVSIVHHSLIISPKVEKQFKTLKLNQKTNPEAIVQFVKENRFPFLGVLGMGVQENDLYSDFVPFCVAFFTVDFSFENRKQTSFWRNRVERIAQKKKNVKFVIADELRYGQLMEKFGVTETGSEINFGCVKDDGFHYPMLDIDDSDFSEDDYLEFIDNVFSGVAKPHIKSARAPPNKGPHKKVVGTTFNKIVMDLEKDCLLLIHATFCGHCKAFLPTYDKVAKHYGNEKDLVIASIEATDNEYPKTFVISGYPTVFYRAKGSKTPIKYEGERTLEAITKFVDEKRGKKKDEL